MRYLYAYLTLPANRGLAHIYINDNAPGSDAEILAAIAEELARDEITCEFVDADDNPTDHCMVGDPPKGSILERFELEEELPISVDEDGNVSVNIRPVYGNCDWDD